MAIQTDIVFLLLAAGLMQRWEALYRDAQQFLTMIHHAFASLPISTLCVTVVQAAFRALLVSSFSLANRVQAGLLPANFRAIQVAPITPAAQEEHLSTFWSPADYEA
jgi:hypothetical protein